MQPFNDMKLGLGFSALLLPRHERAGHGWTTDIEILTSSTEAGLVNAAGPSKEELS